MRVIYDISLLGLGHWYEQSRSGGYRVDLHVAEGLAASGHCDLLFCANHSSVAYQGCVEFLRRHPVLSGVPLAGAQTSPSWLRDAATRTHRLTRRIIGSNVLPPALRRGAALIDKQVHHVVADTVPPADILHSSAAPLPPRPPRRSPQRFLTLYDFSYLRFPEFYGAAFERQMTAAHRSVTPGDRVITPSQFIRAELAERGVASEDSIDVVPLAADRRIFYPCDDPERLRRVRSKYGIPEGPYVLAINSPDPRKNIAGVIQAFARVVNEEPGSVGSLVLAGPQVCDAALIQNATEGQLSLRGRIVVTGFVDDDDMAALYSGARLFVYPSVYEGFGLPALEAMQCGTPVISSNASSLPEVVGTAGVMVDVADPDAMAQAMLDICESDARRATLAAAGLARAAEFSWERSVAATAAAYRRALGS